MRRMVTLLGTAVAGLSLAGLFQTPAPRPPQAPEPPETAKAEERRIELRTVTADPAADLEEAYDLLRRLREERLEERPRELVERATELYRRGVEAFNGSEENHMREASAYAHAALELARAVALSREATERERSDPELPPPPRRIVVRMVPPGVPGQPLPPIPPALGEVEVEGKIIDQAPSTERRSIRIVPRDGAQPKRQEVRVFTIPVPDGEGGRRFQPDMESMRQLRERLREEAAKAKENSGALREQLEMMKRQAREMAEKVEKEARVQAEQARKQAEDAQDQAREAAADAEKQARSDIEKFVEQFQGQIKERAHGEAEEAREALERAHDRIEEARGEDEGGSARFYLDAARDLYNAARRDAEVGRNERARELARAAEALTMVPQYLAGLPRGEAEDEDEGDEDRPRVRGRIQPRVRIQPRLRIERRERRSEEQPEAEEPAEPEEKEAQGEVELQIERDDAGPLVGVGIALTVTGDTVTVLEVLPDSPAGRSDEIHVGDAITGVQNEDGEMVDLEGKPIEEVVHLLRGEEGSTVKLRIEPKDSDEPSVIELTREPLKLSASGEDDEDDDGDDDDNDGDDDEDNDDDGDGDDDDPSTASLSLNLDLDGVVEGAFLNGLEGLEGLESFKELENLENLEVEISVPDIDVSDEATDPSDLPPPID